MSKLLSLFAATLLVVLTAAAASALQSAPVAVADSATLDEDTIVVIYPLLNDSDPQGGSLRLVGVSTTPAGETRVDGPAVVFTPEPNWNGKLELAYLVASAGGESSGEIALTVTPVNDAPVAVDDAAEATSGQPATINVVSNDTDVDGDTLRVSSVGAASHGKVTAAGSAIVYTAEAGYAGLDIVDYTVTDPSGATSQATLQIAVSALPPVSTTVPATTAAPSVTTAVPATTTPPTTVPPATTVTPTTGAPSTTFAGGGAVIGAPSFDAPINGLVPPAGSGNPDGFLASARRTFRSLYLPLFTLIVIGGAAWLMSQRTESPGRKYAVVLVGLDESLPVYARSDVSAEIVYRFEANARQVAVTGNKRSVGGTSWLPVSSPGGPGWVHADHLAEDVAHASFQEDVIEMDIVRSLRRGLKEGSTITTSSRGRIDPETFLRDPGRRELGSYATNRLASLVTDWRATFHIDKTASLAALRPPQLRNFHWISFEAPGRETWMLFFEYQDGLPYPVAALPERVGVELAARN